MIVVDFGTATTFDVVTRKGEYVGGVICPGVGISADALFQRAARLPRVDIRNPGRVIGRSTVGSIQSGLYFGYAAMVRGHHRAHPRGAGRAGARGGHGRAGRDAGRRHPVDRGRRPRADADRPAPHLGAQPAAGRGAEPAAGTCAAAAPIPRRRTTRRSRSSSSRAAAIRSSSPTPTGCSSASGARPASRCASCCAASPTRSTRTRTPGAATRKVGSLAYCAAEVDAARERWQRALAAGGEPDAGSGVAPARQLAERGREARRCRRPQRAARRELRDPARRAWPRRVLEAWLMEREARPGGAARARTAGAEWTGARSRPRSTRTSRPIAAACPRAC